MIGRTTRIPQTDEKAPFAVMLARKGLRELRGEIPGATQKTGAEEIHKAMNKTSIKIPIDKD